MTSEELQALDERAGDVERTFRWGGWLVAATVMGDLRAALDKAAPLLRIRDIQAELREAGWRLLIRTCPPYVRPPLEASDDDLRWVFAGNIGRDATLADWEDLLEKCREATPKPEPEPGWPAGQSLVLEYPVAPEPEPHRTCRTCNQGPVVCDAWLSCRPRCYDWRWEPRTDLTVAERIAALERRMDAQEDHHCD